MIDSKTEEWILLEVTLKQEPAGPDTKEEAELRDRLTKEINEMSSKGIMVEIPSDWEEDD